MSTGSQLLALIAAAVHVAFFFLESVAFTKGDTFRAFGLTTREQAEIVKPMALNQGFYNLFLAIGVVVGLLIWHADVREFKSLPPQSLPGEWAHRGQGAVVLSLACMFAASVVLLISSRGRLLRGVVLQGTAPLIALILIALS